MRFRLLVSLLLLSLVASRSLAQALEPRSYVNVPVGQNFVGLVYAYSEGELLAAPSVPLKDAELEVRSSVLGYARTLDLWGKSGKIDVSMGLQCIEGSGIFRGEFVEAERCGTLDPRVRLAYNFYGAPALDYQSFLQQRPQGLVIGASLQLSAPLGEYHNDKLINSGGNRWGLRPEIGFSNSWGSWSVDGAFSMAMFTENNDFLGGQTVDQDNIYTLQGHIIYSFPRGRWLSLDANYFWGGKTRTDGLSGANIQENSRFGATFTWPLNRQHSLKFLAHTALATTVGNEFETYGVAWQYRWGE